MRDVGLPVNSNGTLTIRKLTLRARGGNRQLERHTLHLEDSHVGHMGVWGPSSTIYKRTRRVICNPLSFV